MPEAQRQRSFDGSYQDDFGCAGRKRISSCRKGAQNVDDNDRSFGFGAVAEREASKDRW